MQEQASRILACLRAYLARTEKAILALRDHRFENFREFMHQRTMAFHNFRARDANARILGYDVSSDPEISTILAQITSSEAELMSLIAAAKLDTNEQLLKLQNGRGKIARYKSRSAERKNLVQTA